MNAMLRSITSPRAASRMCVVAALFLLPVLAAVAGCSDNRISLQAFMDQQQQTTPQPSPLQAPMFSATTQPVGAPAADTQPAEGLPPGTQPAAPAADQYWSPYKLGPGDVLAVTVTGIEQAVAAAPIMVRLNRNGDVNLPMVGRVHVGGMELQDAEETIQNAYVPSVYQQASVHAELAKPETAGVLVTGAVQQPGLVQLPRTQRDLLHAIAGAGGVSNQASGEVLLRRLRSSEEIKYNLLKPEQLQQALTMTPLQNGDVVIVQAATPNVVFIGGLVAAPHVQVNPPGTTMNVLQALASAGGIRTDITPSEITLIRRMPDGKDVHVKLDVERIQHGKDPNINLAPGDILWVPDTLLTKVEDWVNRNIYVRGGFNAVATYDVTGLDFMNDNAKRAAFGTLNNNLQNTVDPLGFLSRQQQLNNIQNRLPQP